MQGAPTNPTPDRVVVHPLDAGDAAIAAAAKSLEQKRTDGVERRPGRLQPAGVYDEPVSQAHPHVHACINAGCNGALAISQRVIQQHFIVANVNPDRRQT